MQHKITLCILSLLLSFGWKVTAQISNDTIAFTATDTVAVVKTDTVKAYPDVSKSQFGYKQLIVPGALLGYGLIGLNTEFLKDFNHNVRTQVRNNIDTKSSIDDYSRYVPAVSVYALNAFGVKGKHNFKDRTIIFVSASLLSNIAVFGLKSVTHVERPDGSSDDSFPSGHTNAAFVGAEFLWQEYKDVSVWYGVGGYAIASATGIFRIVNDRHWFTDVAAGAGIGILSTKAAYWLHPFVNRVFFGKGEKKNTAMLLPFYNGEQAGGSFVMQF
jgi:membrane-associated phospholipid phosphatase